MHTIHNKSSIPTAHDPMITIILKITHESSRGVTMLTVSNVYSSSVQSAFTTKSRVALLDGQYDNGVLSSTSDQMACQSMISLLMTELYFMFCQEKCVSRSLRISQRTGSPGAIRLHFQTSSHCTPLESTAFDSNTRGTAAMVRQFSRYDIQLHITTWLT